MTILRILYLIALAALLIGGTLAAAAGFFFLWQWAEHAKGAGPAVILFSLLGFGLLAALIDN